MWRINVNCRNARLPKKVNQERALFRWTTLALLKSGQRATSNTGRIYGDFRDAAIVVIGNRIRQINLVVNVTRQRNWVASQVAHKLVEDGMPPQLRTGVEVGVRRWCIGERECRRDRRRIGQK